MDSSNVKVDILEISVGSEDLLSKDFVGFGHVALGQIGEIFQAFVIMFIERFVEPDQKLACFTSAFRRRFRRDVRDFSIRCD